MSVAPVSTSSASAECSFADLAFVILCRRLGTVEGSMTVSGRSAHWERARGEMADAPDLGSGSVRSGGSSPLERTIPLRLAPGSADGTARPRSPVLKARRPRSASTADSGAPTDRSGRLTDIRKRCRGVRCLCGRDPRRWFRQGFRGPWFAGSLSFR